ELDGQSSRVGDLEERWRYADPYSRYRRIHRGQERRECGLKRRHGRVWLERGAPEQRRQMAGVPVDRGDGDGGPWIPERVRWPEHSRGEGMLERRLGIGWKRPRERR